MEIGCGIYIEKGNVVELSLGRKSQTMKNKHMTMEDRIEIQECLCKEMTFKAIARRIGKDPTTVSKEVKLHAHDYRNSFSKSDETCPKLLKALYLATHEIAKKWTMPLRNWGRVLGELEIMYPDRLG